MLLSFLASAATFIVAKKLLDYIWPTQMSYIYINTAYYSINTCIVVGRCIQKYVNMLLYNPHKYNTTITFIKNGIELRECSVKQLEHYMQTLNDYDLILYKEASNSNSNFNSTTKFIYNVVTLNTQSIRSQLYKNMLYSSVRFLDITVIYRDDVYSINFGEENYYIVGNIILSKEFIQWYLYNKHGVVIEDGESYMCTLMDNNINIFSITSSNYILVEQDSYLVVNIINSEDL
jgi:hypothetical protein